MQTTRTKPAFAAARTGAVLVIALICLLLLTALAASLVRTALMQREQVIHDEWQLQAEWLAEAALDRALMQLNASADYEGEEWLPESNDKAAPPGRIRIAILQEEGESGARLARITVTADVPADAQQRARVQRSLLVPHEI